MEISELVRKTRKSLGLSQSQLAEKANVNEKDVSNIENGKNVYSFKLIAVLDGLELEVKEKSR